MPRSRNIKPALFKNELLGEADPLITILFTGLWCLADREGRLEDRPKRIRAEIFPYREETTSKTVEVFLCWLMDNDFITRYANEYGEYIQIHNWSKHQNPHHKEIASLIPNHPSFMDKVCKGYVPLNNSMRAKIYARDGKVCAYCGATERLNIDHIIPVDKLGNSVEGNLQVLCSKCNGLKSNNIVDNDLCIKHGMVMLEPCTDDEQPNEVAPSPLIPDSLIPDSLDTPPPPNGEWWPLESTVIRMKANGIEWFSSDLDDFRMRIVEGDTKDKNNLDFRFMKWCKKERLNEKEKPNGKRTPTAADFLTGDYSTLCDTDDNLPETVLPGHEPVPGSGTDEPLETSPGGYES